jgi:hypothetical protein
MFGELETIKQDRRKAPRVQLSRTVLVRPFDVQLPEEVCTIANFSRTGLYFETSVGHYYAGMKVFVAWSGLPNDTETAKVMRVKKLRGGKWGVALSLV